MRPMTGSPPTLNLVGAGRVGRTLAALWQAAGVFRLGDVLTRSPLSAQAAVAALGAGRPVSEPAAMRPAEVWLLATPDGALADSAARLANAGLAPAVAWHCSGFSPAAALAPLQAAGWAAASAHPALSFADPAAAQAQFAGTACALEGDDPAVARAEQAFGAIGGRCFRLQAADKPLYHGAAVLVSNFPPVLAAAAAELWQGCGMPPELIAPLWQAFAKNVADNLLRLGPAAALTGPAARGDSAVVQAETAAMQARDPALAQAYAALSTLAARLAREGAALAPSDGAAPLSRART